MTNTVGTVDTASGNSKKSRCFLLTWNNYDEKSFDYVKDYIDEYCKKGAVQEEIGEKGTKHLQIGLYFENARSFKSLNNDFPKCHIEKGKNMFAVINYCKKDKSLNGKRYVKGMKSVKDPLEGKILYDWEKELIDIINGPVDDRKIYWYWSREGGFGKTQFAKHLCITRKDVLFLSGKASDVKCGIAQWIEKGKDLNCAIFGFTKSLEKFISYEAIENAKDGIFFSGKYESGMIVYDQPHVICFANFPPDKNKLSKDRWVISNIGQEMNKESGNNGQEITSNQEEMEYIVN